MAEKIEENHEYVVNKLAKEVTTYVF